MELVSRPRQGAYGAIFKLAGGAKVVIVDETVINFRGKEVYLWAAIDPETKKIVFLYPSYSRSYLAALKFFTLMMRFTGKPELVITDSGTSWLLED